MLLIRFKKRWCLPLLLLMYCSALQAVEFKHELLTENDGFTSSIIFSIEQDKHGYLWFGTAYNGIMRYDGKNVVSFVHDPSNPQSIPHNNAGNLLLNSNGDLWIGSWGGGAAFFDYNSQVFTHYPSSLSNPTSIHAPRVQNIFEDSDANIWLGTYNKGLSLYNQQSDDFTHLPFKAGFGKNSQNTELSSQRVWDIEQSDNNGIWLATSNGLNYLNTRNQQFSHYYPQPNSELQESNRIRRIHVANDNVLFLGSQNGVLKFDTLENSFYSLPIEGRSTVGPIYSIIKTTFGEYWVTTGFGVYSFTETELRLKKVPLDFDDKCSQTLFQDRQGTIWLSCEGVGIYKINKTDLFTSFQHPELEFAFAMHQSNDNAILVGTYKNGLKKWIPETNTVVPLSKKIENQPELDIRFITQNSKGKVWFANSQRIFSLNDSGVPLEFLPSQQHTKFMRQIRHIAIDALDRIWVATELGIFQIDSHSGDYTFFSYGQIVKKAYKNTPLIMTLVDRNNAIWILVKNQFYRFDEASKTFTALPYNESATEQADEFNFVYTAFHDTQGNYWVSNRLGLYKANMATGERELISAYFNERENRAIRYITEDKNNNLWLVTAVDVSRLNINTGALDHFDDRDGLPGSRYYYNPTSRESDGSIYISSIDGIFFFNPDAVSIPSADKTIHLTNFEVLGLAKKFNVNALMAEEVTLPYDQTNIKFEFATLDLLNARQINYQYKLEGFDTNWIENGTANTATYTNLSGGDYVFRVRARVKDNQWYDNELAVQVSINTPFWQQWWMVLVYSALIFLAVMFYLQRQKRAVMKLEHQVAEKTADIALESQKLAAANRIKTQFLANMSHEIRTPLTTVIGQAEAIICREIDPKDIYKEIEIIHDSSIYLLTLLNDILDLTKIEENKFQLEYAPQDLHSLLNNINTMFSMQARTKGLSFEMDNQLPLPFVVNVDGLRLKQILVNLLSNALKFTQNGHVALKAKLTSDHLVFHVKDTGIGISHEQLAQIFDSFTQGDASIRRRFGGSGLGLHLSNQFAVLMKGNINVQSELNKGSIFTLSLPLPEISSLNKTLNGTSNFEALSSTPLFSGKILLAEDHEDNSRLISRLLTKLGLSVYTAKDGHEAVEQYKKVRPEVILMDIQMPRMDGLQAFSALRALGCEKPIIALTANAMPNEVEEYFTLGFDAYIQKPIDRESLISTIATFFDSKENDSMSKANTVLGSVDMSDLIETFTQGLAKEWEEFVGLSQAHDIQAIGAQAHKLSGAAQLFGFRDLSEKATQLELSIKHGSVDMDSIQDNLHALKLAIERCSKQK